MIGSTGIIYRSSLAGPKAEVYEAFANLIYSFFVQYESTAPFTVPFHGMLFYIINFTVDEYF